MYEMRSYRRFTDDRDLCLSCPMTIWLRFNEESVGLNKRTYHTYRLITSTANGLLCIYPSGRVAQVEAEP
jgi:hypothetical protein